MPRLRSAAALLVLAGCGHAPAPPEPEPLGELPCRELQVRHIPHGASVILVVNDTMRRDRLGAYGGPAATPAFDGFAEENLLFTDAIAPAPWTKPSIASLFTSLYPSQHRVVSDPRLAARGGPPAETASQDVLANGFVTLAEILRQAGLRTAAFVASPWLERRNGFAQGFETYEDSFGSHRTSGSELTEAALEWLAARPAGEPFFLYLHYTDSQRPYGRLTPEEADELPPPEPEDAQLLGTDGDALCHRVLRRTDGTPLFPPDRPASRAAVVRAYDRGVEDFDRALGALLDGLRAHEAWGRTAIVVTSDHGEALFGRGYGDHGSALYDEEIAIPLAARFPGAEPTTGRIDCPVSLVDVLPSVCAWLGLRPPPFAVGWSVVDGPSPRAPVQRRFLVSEGTQGGTGERAIRTREYELFHLPAKAGGAKESWRLFDVQHDPRQEEDLLSAPLSPEVEDVFHELRQALPRAVPPYTPPPKSYVPLDQEQLDRLRSQGYLSD